MNSQNIDIENEAMLENVSKFLEKHNEGPGIGKVINFFPFDRLRNINSEEKISKVITILSKFLSSRKFFTCQQTMEHCFEFVLENWKRFIGQLKLILPDLLDFFIKLLIKLRENNEISKINVNPERICNQILETFKEAPLRKHCVNVLVEIFSSFQLESKEIYDDCIKEVYLYNTRFDYFELYRLGATLSMNLINFKDWSSYKHFRSWILSSSSFKVPFFQMLSDKDVINEFLKCLLGVYSIKDPDDYEITRVYIIFANSFNCFLTIESCKANVVEIIKKMLHDLFLRGDFPPITNDFFDNIKDFSLVSKYLSEMFGYKRLDRREIADLSKEVTIRCYSSENFHPITLKAISYLFPKYLKISTTNENVILNALSRCDIERILTSNLAQLKWILGSDRLPLIYRTISFWLKKTSVTAEFIRILQETDKVKFLIQTIMTDFEDDFLSNRAASLLRSMNDYDVSNSLISYIPSAIKYPKALALLLKSKPSIPENLKLLEFLCNMIASILPYIYKTEAFIEACKYSAHLMMHAKNNKEAVGCFIKFETISVLTKACISKADEISISGSQTLAFLAKLEDLLGFEAEFSIEIDFRKVLKGSITRKNWGLTLLENLLKSRDENNRKMLKILEEDILGQFLYVQEISDEKDGMCFKVLTLFLKKYNYLAFSCVTPNFVHMVCLNINNEDGGIDCFCNFLDTLIQLLLGEKKILVNRLLNVPSVKNFTVEHKSKFTY